MNYTITQNTEENFTEVHLEGYIDENDFKEGSKKIVEHLKKYSCAKVLVDYRKSTLHLKFLSLYEIPEELTSIAENAGLSVHKVKRALLFNDLGENIVFFETVSFNRGHNVKVFTDFDKAKKWLLEQ